MTTLLIDGDILCYRVSVTHQDSFLFGEELHVETDLEGAQQALERELESIKWFLTGVGDPTWGPLKVVFAFSDPSRHYWRHELGDYKSHRKDSTRPELLEDLKEYIESNYQTYWKPKLEADDVLGILSTDPDYIKGTKIIVSNDKDFKTVPGWYYNFVTEELIHLPEWKAAYWHLYQTLVGDRCDGFPGCPGIGEVRASRLLEEPDWPAVEECPAEVVYAAAWPYIVKAFEKKGLRESDAIFNARLARICQTQDWDHEKQEVKLWEPPKMVS